MRLITQLVVHCSASPANLDIGVKEIRQWHLARGWNDIGYHKVIRRDGTIEDGRPEGIPGAHVEGHNQNSLGVCLVGGIVKSPTGDLPEANFTAAQYAALERVLRTWRIKYPHTEILGHRDFPHVAKDCPCFSVKEWCWDHRLDPEDRACHA